MCELEKSKVYIRKVTNEVLCEDTACLDDRLSCEGGVTKEEKVQEHAKEKSSVAWKGVLV